MKLIDKSKKSNKRCWNCFYYSYGSKKREYNDAICDVFEKKFKYWKSGCKHFKWDETKKYKEEEK